MTPRSLPRWGLAVVGGRSMEPTLRAGDRILVRYAEPRPGRAPRPGEVVLVRLPPGPDGPRPVAVKRLTRVETGGGLWVESDNLGAGVDSWTLGALPPEALVARVVPGPGKRLRRWLSRFSGAPPS